MVNKEKKKKEVKTIKGSSLKTIFDWMEEYVKEAGVSLPVAADRAAEKVFYIHGVDSATPVAEGPPGTQWDWTGYHSTKHGLLERFMSLKGEQVNMSEQFFGEKWRWIEDEFKDAEGNLKGIPEKEAREYIQNLFDQANQGKPADLSKLIDVDKFTKDAADLYKKYAKDPNATVWQGRYVTRTGALDVLQTNVDFAAKGVKFRIAVNAETGQVLNFFWVDPQFEGKMKFAQVIIKWKGKITNVFKYAKEGTTVKVVPMATPKGLMLQGLKAGVITGAITSGFLGAVEGFEEEGMIGAVKGLFQGALAGGVVGGATGGIIAVAQRIFPKVGKYVKLGTKVGLVYSLFSVMLDSSEISAEPQTWVKSVVDEEGNKHFYRNLDKEGNPRGIMIKSTDGSVFEFAEDGITRLAPFVQEAYEEKDQLRGNPLCEYHNIRAHVVKWQRSQTPEGGSLWWWLDEHGEEHISTYMNKSDEQKDSTLFAKEIGYRF